MRNIEIIVYINFIVYGDEFFDVEIVISKFAVDTNYLIHVGD